MSTDRDLERIVRSWMGEGVTQLPDRVLDVVLDQVPSTPQRRPWWLAWRPFIMSNAGRIALAAAAAAVVAVLGVTILQPSWIGGPSASDSPSPSPWPSPSAPAAIVGLPPEGATLSDPGTGDLVLQFDSEVTTIWIYTDGRLIWNRFQYVPAYASDPFMGLAEQRLTPSGVEFLLSEVVSTGLFEGDLALARESNAFLDILVRNGDRFVRATWATRAIVGQDAPIATLEQATALQELSALLTGQESWPASAWEEQAFGAYVPPWYAVCFRGLPDRIHPDAARDLLPQPAQDLLLAGERTPEGRMPYDGFCSRMATDDARALARILADAGIQREGPENGVFWLRYLLPDQPVAGNAVWISFGPVLPHGEATWLGPG